MQNKILKFGAKWCKACTALSDLDLKDLRGAESIDVDSNAEAVKKWQITKLPTVLIVDGDSVIEKIVGKEEIEERFS